MSVYNLIIRAESGQKSSLSLFFSGHVCKIVCTKELESLSCISAAMGGKTAKTAILLRS